MVLTPQPLEGSAVSIYCCPRVKGRTTQLMINRDANRARYLLASTLLVASVTASANCREDYDYIDNLAAGYGVEQRVPLLNPGSNSTRQSFLRLVNENPEPADAHIVGFDDSGRFGTVSVRIEAREAIHLTAQELESGSGSIVGNLCDGTGKWRFAIYSDQLLDVMSLLRTPDGFVTNLSNTVPRADTEHLIYFFNPSSNQTRQSFLRISNLTAEVADVLINAINDDGTSGEVRLLVEPRSSVQLNSTDLEVGNFAKGLEGALGTGSGKWRLYVSSQSTLEVMSLIRSPGGTLTNLSDVIHAVDGQFFVPYAEDGISHRMFFRLINEESESVDVVVRAYNDLGESATGEVHLGLDAGEAMQVSLQDLLEGNSSLGLNGALGEEGGRWALEFFGPETLVIQHLIRSNGGFLSNLSRSLFTTTEKLRMPMFNPGRNVKRQSLLRITNHTNFHKNITVHAIDDLGERSRSAYISLGARESRLISSVDLENSELEISEIEGGLETGSGKWRFFIEILPFMELSAQGILRTPSGLIANMTTPAQSYNEDLGILIDVDDFRAGPNSIDDPTVLIADVLFNRGEEISWEWKILSGPDDFYFTRTDQQQAHYSSDQVLQAPLIFEVTASNELGDISTDTLKVELSTLALDVEFIWEKFEREEVSIPFSVLGDEQVKKLDVRVWSGRAVSDLRIDGEFIKFTVPPLESDTFVLLELAATDHGGFTQEELVHIYLKTDDD